MLIQPHQRVLFIGDSITDTGRAQPIAEGLGDPLGRGYVTMIEALLIATYPGLGARVINVGSSGNTVRDLEKRWERDVTNLRPDWLSICIGVNDVWRQFDLPRQKDIHIDVAAYETTYDALLANTRPSLKGLVLMTPFYIETHKGDAMLARMDQFGAVVKKLATKYDARFVDTQAAFDKVLGHMHSTAIASDRVHPNQAGHMVLAKAWLNAIGFDWQGK